MDEDSEDKDSLEKTKTDEIVKSGLRGITKDLSTFAVWTAQSALDAAFLTIATIPFSWNPR
jgi:hypothetical protein